MPDRAEVAELRAGDGNDSIKHNDFGVASGLGEPSGCRDAGGHDHDGGAGREAGGDHGGEGPPRRHERFGERPGEPEGGGGHEGENHAGPEIGLVVHRTSRMS